MSLEVETLFADDTPAAYVIRGKADASETVFPTPADLNLQVGFIGRAAGEAVDAHVHLPLERTIWGTTEVLVVVSGSCYLDIFDANRSLVDSASMTAGDVVLLVSGGHGFRMVEDTVLFEVKQGPYGGPAEKERFAPQ